MPAGFTPNIYQLSAYTTPLVPKAVAICSTQNRQSKVLQASLDFIKTAPTFALQLNINQGTPGNLLPGGIQGVYVDNFNNNSDLILLFPDTGYTIICEPNTTKFFPVFSNGDTVNIYNGIQTNTVVSGQSINLFFTNFLIDTFETANLPAVRDFVQITSFTDGTPIYVTEVKGDFHADWNFFMTAPGVRQILPIPPINKGFYIITNLQIGIMNAYITSGTPITLSIGIQYASSPTTAIISKVVYINTDDTYIPHTSLWDHDDEYLSLDATQVINGFWDHAVPGGVVIFSFDYLWTASR